MAMLQSHISFQGQSPRAPRAAVRSVVLLSGSVRPTPFQAAIGRSILELPIDQELTLLDHWIQAAAALAEGPQPVELRLLANEAGRLPRQRAAGAVRLTVRQDPSELRGTGGILRDLSADYDDEDLLLVAGGAQYLLRPLAELARDLLRGEADLTLAAHDDGTPSSVMLVRCGCLRVLPEIGFIDLKEQALPVIARHHRVRVRRYGQPTAMPVRTEAQYVSALRHRHGAAAGAKPGPFEEDWDLRFRIVESGAQVFDGAMLHDSVVLAGGTVERRATVVRSVVCGGGRVRRGATVTDAVVAASTPRQRVQ